MSEIKVQELVKVIVICDNRGLTMLGDCDPMEVEKEHGSFILIRNARCVMRWGTERHLAELAKHGPTEDTILGEEKDFYASRAQITGFYKCSRAVKW